MAYTEQSFIGKGKVYVGPVSAGSLTDAKRDIGNVGELTLTIESEEKSLMNYRTPGGGEANSIDRITGVNGAITMYDWDIANLSMAIFGSTTAVTAGAVTNEAHVAYTGGLVRLNFAPDTSTTITVTNTAGTVTYVSTGSTPDYNITKGGVEITTGGSIADGSDIHVDYTKDAGNVANALVTQSTEYAVTVVGLNEAQSGKAVIIDLYRVKFSPVENLNFISDEYGELSLSFSVIQDTTLAEATGQYFKIEQVS